MDQVPTDVTVIEQGLAQDVQQPLASFTDDSELELDGEVSATVVSGGLFSPTDLRAVNHDPTQRAVWVGWQSDATVTVTISSGPVDLTYGNQSHLLIRLQRADNADLNNPDVCT
eukprot:SAG31_NODE_12382_length_946_cov_0.847698_1_plen_114_part_00